ncbi:PREDICTED: low affinity immunoglobulin epsilon Fc receptor-like [Pygoscelis adeliae]|uniref:low affinity immunoglobulin epsilon Fc receptor-like n=1 Tax=Pygoscelis adeliae TaxID=9238 RepID=UPI0004F4DE51|nr:PREDICTED: low affinity immunoglobulin epsilon Fc receptor-like [Pygoscelis adeliae]
MSQGKGAFDTYEKCDFAEKMELEERERRKAPKGALSPERAIALLYVLLALTFVLFMALTIVNLRRVSAAWEALEQAQMRSENSHTTAWHNLSEVQRTLDKQLSGELKTIHGRLLNVSQEVGNVRWKMRRCEAECRNELSDRLRVLEERDTLELVLQQLAEVKQEQSQILCTKCPAGWQQFAKTCYFFSTTKQPWLAAKQSCNDFNAHLAVVDTEQENKFLANHIMKDRVFWLGLTDMDSESNWQWVNGRSLSLSYVFSLIGGFWNSGEPNNAGQQGEDCATIYSSGLWNDVLCSSAEAWICERSC